jgi:glycosyl-4,4'-diaponeurosporenoate acyltransferase
MTRGAVGALNFVLWPVIQLGVARVVVLAPARWFNPQSSLFRLSQREREAGFYSRVFGLRHWRHWLPDGAPWVGGRFSTKRIVSREPLYLDAFMRETCRGELAHWITMGFAPLFALWNPPWADGVIAAYALVSNLPCVLSQRRLRAGLLKLSSRHSR